MSESQGMFEIRREYPVPVVKVGGDLDLSNVREFEATLEHAARTQEKGLILDLTDATYFDSRTLHVLMRFSQRIKNNRKIMLTVRPKSEPAIRLLELTGVNMLIPILVDMESALKAMATATLD